jgi:hypothetical protein
MTTGHMAQPRGDEPEPGRPHDGAQDEPTDWDARGLIVTAILLLLVALGVRTFVTVNRTRLRDSDENPTRSARSAPAPLSVIRIAAAPHSVVHVVSASKLGRSHVEMPVGPGP